MRNSWRRKRWGAPPGTWSPDGAHVAFARVDETPVRIVQRFEIAADGIAAFDQRYPVAGGAKSPCGWACWTFAAVRGVARLDMTRTLPRAGRLAARREDLAIQRESRDQRRLDLLFADIATGKTRVVLTKPATPGSS